MFTCTYFLLWAVGTLMCTGNPLICNITAIVAVTILSTLIASAVPIREQFNENWRNPCGGSTQTGFSAFGDIVIPSLTKEQIAETLELIVQQFDEAQRKILTIRNNYRDDRVPGLTSGSSSCSYSNDYDNIFLHVEDFPDMSSIHSGSIICSNLNVTLLEDYEILVRVMIFLEQTIHDEEMHESGQYSLDLGESYRSLLNTLCNFKTLEHDCGESQKTLNVTDIVNRYQKGTAYQRHKRDYIFVKDMDILLTLLKRRYNTCQILYENAA